MTQTYASPPTRLPQRFSFGIGAGLSGFVLIGSAVFLIIASLYETERAPFMAAAGALSAYLFFEVAMYLRKRPNGALVSPPFLATFLYFYMSHVLPAMARLWFPDVDTRWVATNPEFWDVMPMQILWTGLAAFSMWRGYYWAVGLSRRVAGQALKTPWLRKEMNPELSFALMGQAVYLLASLYAGSVGMLGIVGNDETRAAQIEVQQVLAIAGGVGTLSFMLILVAYFRKRHSGQAAPGLAIVCLASLALQLIVGLLSGFKQQLVLPFMVAGFAHFLVYKRLSFGMVAAACVALAVAYMVIEPYRAYLGREAMHGSAGITDMIDAVQQGMAQREDLMRDERSMLQQVSERFDTNGIASLGMDFVDDGLLTEEDEAWMREGIFLAPVTAIVPRFLWPDKPSYATGVWFGQNVLLAWHDTVTSVGMGPVTYLYMCGGVIGVVLGFLFIGGLQSVVFRGLAQVSAGGMLIYIAGTTFFVILPSNVGAAFAGFIQMSILAYLGQFFMLRPDSKPARQAPL